MNALRFNLLSALLILCLGSCLACTASATEDPDFSGYWHQGKAEITSYDLQQARYGEVHPGHAVLIFVTEDFSRSKQVKLDDPEAAGDDRVPILKLNATRKFNTGIYPYSMMTSIFSPLAGDHAPLKVTTSSQEWCGHTFTQFNQQGGGYHVRQYSYFESEGDQELDLAGARLEDELWTTLRLDPAALPTGTLQLVPGSIYLRLRHVPIAAYEATAKLSPGGEEGIRVYTVTYPKLGRSLEIRFRDAFPFEIEGWQETYRSGFGPGAKELTTRATRMKRMMSPYWTQHDLDDAHLRKELGLD
jgi:hypothetical protein